MKKIIIVMFTLLLVGCRKEQYTICNIDINNNVQNYKVTGEYKIYYKDNYVTKIEKNEKYETFDKHIIDYLNEAKRLEYYNLNDLYGGITYDINLSDNIIYLSSTINMESVDVNNMVKNKYLDENYVVSNKLTISGIKYFYESKGAICDI